MCPAAVVAVVVVWLVVVCGSCGVVGGGVWLLGCGWWWCVALGLWLVVVCVCISGDGETLMMVWFLIVVMWLFLWYGGCLGIVRRWM